MDDWAARLFALVMLLSAIALMIWHVRMWRAAKREELSPKDRDYYWRQFRRRVQTSAMLVVLAIMIFVVSSLNSDVAKVVLGAGMLVLVLWIGLLAAIDVLATRHHYASLRSGYLVEQAKLEIEARRLRNLGGNGKPRSDHPDLGPKNVQ